jgi:hypothetical protein
MIDARLGLLLLLLLLLFDDGSLVGWVMEEPEGGGVGAAFGDIAPPPPLTAVRTPPTLPAASGFNISSALRSAWESISSENISSGKHQQCFEQRLGEDTEQGTDLQAIYLC